MIAFASLFLGLVFGAETVEIVVGDSVAAVELRLDGERLGVMRGAPWSMPCDFGAELAPRLLEAVAFDDQDREIGRAVQWLNLPQPRAVISTVLEPRRADGSRAVRVSWESAAGAAPESVSAALDGTPLAVADPHRIALPPVDEGQLHLLQIEMRFEDRVSSRVDLTFGGAYTDEVSTEMTALPMWATKKPKRPPTAAAVGDWFVKGGERLRVITVEKGTAEVVVVMGRAFPRFVAPGERYKPPKSLRLAEDLRLRFVSPVPEQTEGVATTFELFPISPAYDAGSDDLYRMLSSLMRPPQDGRPRAAAAVAVAGLAAYDGRHRRAVVLIPDSDPQTPDALDPARARRYLEHLRVPFYVWDPERRPARDLAAWGEVEAAGSLEQLAAAHAELRDDLEGQWIVWLDGRHLPQDISLAPEAEGFTLRR